MSERILFAIVLLLTTLCSVAQTSTHENADKSWSTRVNIDLLRIGDSPEDVYEGDFGINAGVAYRHPIANRWYVEPSLYAFYNRFAPGVNTNNNDIWYARAIEVGVRGIMSCGYIISQSPNSNFSVAVGPLINLPFIGKVSDAYPKDYRDHQLKHDLYSGSSPFKQKRLDIGINLQLCWAINQWEIVASNSKGLLNLSDFNIEGYNHAINQNNLCIGVGYRF